MTLPVMNGEAPRPTPVSRPWFDACRQGELLLQHCAECGEYQFYPRVLCAGCGGGALAWRKASGEGRIASFTVVRQGVAGAEDKPPVLALVDLAEGPRMMSVIEGADPADVTVGAAVRVDYRAWSEDISMPVFLLRED